jgi:hypothetical protein
MINGDGVVKAVQPLRRVIMTRPITASRNYGFHADTDSAADQAFTACRLLLNEEKSVSEISELTGLSEAFISALADRFS